MFLVGLTGGIASGKSTISTMLAKLGAEVIDADVVAREVVEPGTPGLKEVIAEFGEFNQMGLYQEQPLPSKYLQT
jgi:dephospho-CoA kinase